MNDFQTHATVEKRNSIVRHRFIPFALCSSWIMIGTTTMAYLTFSELPNWVIYLPFFLSFLLIGLPHGAVDHCVLLSLNKQSFTIKNLAKVILPYLMLAFCYLMFWVLSPAISFLFFILITWYHWGQGDLYSLSMFTGRQHLNTRFSLALALFIRGALPMLVPLLAFPEVYRSVAMDITGVLMGSREPELEFFFSNTFRLVTGAGFIVSLCIYFISTFQLTTSWLLDIFEVSLLIALFSLTHPVLAIGVYFCFWHGLRHVVRIMIHQQKESHDKIHRPVLSFMLDAAPTTGAALLIMGIMYLLVPFQPDTTQQFIGLYLILIAILTLPHTWVVIRMDKQDRIWQVSSP